MAIPFRSFLIGTAIALIGAAAVSGALRVGSAPEAAVVVETSVPTAPAVTAGIGGVVPGALHDPATATATSVPTDAASGAPTTTAVTSAGPVVDATSSPVIPQFGRTLPTIAIEQPFATCDEAKAAGRKPLRKEDPRFNAALDPDGNGIACE